MLKFISTVLIALTAVLSLAACGAQAEEPQKPEKDWSAAEGTEKEPEKKTHQLGLKITEDFYIGNDIYWNGDSTLTFQQEKSLITLNLDNEVIHKVNLSKEPDFMGEPWLIPSGNYIFARDYIDYYEGMSYYTYGGKIHFANVSLYTAEGEHIRDYPKASSENDGQGISKLPVEDNDYVMASKAFWPNESFAWIDSTRAYVFFYSAVGIYDFEADEGHIIWNGREVKKELGAKTVSPGRFGFVGDKLYFSSFEEYSDDGNNTKYSVWVIEDETPRRLTEGEIIFADGTNVVYAAPSDDPIYTEDIAYVINENYPEPKELIFSKWFDSQSFSSYKKSELSPGGILSFSTENGERSEFYSYFTDLEFTDFHYPTFDSYADLLGAREVDGRMEYYFTGYKGDSVVLWRNEGYDNSGEAYYTELETIKGGDRFFLDPNVEGYAVYIHEDTWYVRMERIPESGDGTMPVPEGLDKEPEQPKLKNASDYSREEMEFAKLYYGGELPEYFYTDIGVQQEFDRVYKKVNSWLSLSEEDLRELVPSDTKYTSNSYSAYCPETETYVYILTDDEAYISPYYYIWSDPKIKQRKIIDINSYAEANKFTAGNKLVVFDREDIFTYDMATGNELSPAIDFDFGYEAEYGSERVLVGLGYDEKAENYVAVYLDWFLRDNETWRTDMKLGIFDKEGKHIKNIATGEEMAYCYKNFYQNIMNISFPKAGTVSLLLPIDENRVEIDYQNAEPMQAKEGIYALWDKFAGEWAEHDVAKCRIRFYLKEGVPYVNYAKDSHSIYFNAKGRDFKQVSDTVWEINLEEENGTEHRILIDTAKPGDSAINISVDSVDYAFIVCTFNE